MYNVEKYLSLENANPENMLWTHMWMHGKLKPPLSQILVLI